MLPKQHGSESHATSNHSLARCLVSYHTSPPFGSTGPAENRMAKRQTRRPSASRATEGAAGRAGTPSCGEAIPLAGLAALLVATPLVPSESTGELGVGAIWVTVALIVCAGWLVTALIRRKTDIRFGAIDALVVLMIALIALSALVMMRQGCARATINMAWQWVGFGALFFLARQSLREPVAVRAVCAVMIGLAVCLSALAFYQYFYSLPATRAEYARNPEAMLRDAGVNPAPGSPERKLFEDRLNSTEPLATFALANSLAGLLAPWLIVTLGIAVWARPEKGKKNGDAKMSTGADLPDRSLPPFSVLAAGVSAILIGVCLLLTKSRTALLALGLGVCLLAASRWSLRRLGTWRLLLLAVVIGGSVAGALAVGLWDRLVLTETPKSVLYRLQYWQATADMIGDHPWFGCGPGNFQHYYTAYKLPQASESIADPHNLFFEVAATAGVPALLALVAVLIVAAWRGFVCGWKSLCLGSGSTGSRAQNSLPAQQAARPATDAPAATMPIVAAGAYAGSLIGVALGWWTGFVFGMTPDVGLLVWGLPAAALLAAALHPWTVRGRTPAVVFWIALLVLTVNLLAAGGISFAGIAPSWWLLLALAVNSTEGAVSGRRVPRIVVGLLAAGALTLVAASFLTLYQPVLRCRAKLDEGLALLRVSRFADAEAAFREAADADPHSAEPWVNVATLYHGAVMDSGAGEALARFEDALADLLRRNPHAHTLRKEIGDWRLALFARWGDRRQLDEAIGAYTEALRLYPNHAYGHAQLAWAYHLAGDQPSASREADEALRLDALHPHREKKLSQQKLYDPAGKTAEPAQNAEQTMQGLRK